MTFLRNIGNQVNPSLISKWWYYTVSPYVYFYTLLIATFVQKFVVKFCFFWKVGNYADAYWFLYSNKQVASYVRGSGYVTNVKSVYNRVRRGKINRGRFRIKFAVKNFNHQFNYRLSSWSRYKQ